MAIQKNTSIPEVQQTIVMLRKLNADERIQQEAFYREKRLHDEASALGSARREGEAKGLAKGLAKGREEGEAKGREDALKEALENIVRSGISEEQAKKILGLA